MALYSLLLASLSPFTFSDGAHKAEISSEEMRAVGDRCRRVLHLIVPLTLYTVYVNSKQLDGLSVEGRIRGYTRHNTLATWGMCISMSIKILLEWLQRDDMIKQQSELLGPISVSLIYSIPIYAGYIFYFTATMEETSAIHAVLQISLLLMCDVISNAQKVLDLYKNTVSLTAKTIQEIHDKISIPMIKTFQELYRGRVTHEESTV